MYERLGIKVKKEGKDIIVPSKQKMKVGSDIQGNHQYVEANPWPNFPTDLFPILTVLAASCEGETFVFNKMDELQLMFTNDLVPMGMKTFVGGTQRLLVQGPTKWKGSKIFAPYIIQATMAIFLAALAAEGETIIYGADSLLRRYPDLVEKYQSLGAQVEWTRSRGI
jgi:UDP-N-acetylglucosamine 1-carboxyvinyltransferase